MVQVLRSAHFVNGKWLTVTDAFGNTVSEVKNVDGLMSGKQTPSSSWTGGVPRNLVVDQNGVVTAIWSQSKDKSTGYFYADNAIIANRYDPKTHLWSTARKISEGNFDGLGVPLTSVSTPGMVVDKLGNITAAWSEGPARHQMWSSRYEPLFGTWLKLQRINDKLPGYVYGQPLLAVDDSGAVTTAWVQVDGVNQSIWFNRNENGAWIGEKLVSAGEPNTEYLLDKIQQHKNGAVTIIWLARAASGPTTLWTSLFEKGVWTTKKLAAHADPTEPLWRAFSIGKPIEDGLGHVTLIFLEYGATATAVVYKNWVIDYR